MKIERIQTFISLVNLESYSLTAEKLDLTQPAVSMQISSLEKYFDTKLLHKEKGEIILTPAGKVVYQEGKKILKNWSYLKQRVVSEKHKKINELEIASSTIPSAYLLPEIISKLDQKIENLKTHISVGDSKAMIHLLENDEVDLIVVGYKPDNNKFEAFEIFNDKLSLIVPAAYKIDTEKEISLIDLQNHKLLIREEGSGTRKATLAAFKSKDLSLEDFNIVSQLGSTESVISAVESGLGIAFISAVAANKAARCRKVKILNVKDLICERKFYLAYNKNRQNDLLIDAFVEIAKDIL